MFVKFLKSPFISLHIAVLIWSSNVIFGEARAFFGLDIFNPSIAANVSTLLTSVASAQGQRIISTLEQLTQLLAFGANLTSESAIIVCVIVYFAVKYCISFDGYNYYVQIKEERIVNQLYRRTTVTNETITRPICKYHHILENKQFTYIWDIQRIISEFSENGIRNGSYAPERCTTMFSVAILVPYRNRKRQLDMFLPYMHSFLRQQDIHYKIFVIEQGDNNLFNRAALLNIGARYAISQKFPCLIQNDVDLLPLDAANFYVCSQMPRHMSVAIDKNRYWLPYDEYAGGVLAIRSDTYTTINGMSNTFEGWGGEDDDLYVRIVEKYNLSLVRYPWRMSRYHMMRHARAPINVARFKNFEKMNPQEGYNTVDFDEVSVENYTLYTRIVVKLK